MERAASGTNAGGAGGIGAIDSGSAGAAVDAPLVADAAGDTSESFDGAPPEIVHVCAGDGAPRTDALVEVAQSLDGTGKLAGVRRLPLPPRAIIWASQNADRFVENFEAFAHALRS